MDCVLYDQVKKYQAGNNEIALEILETFSPLLKKYARLLPMEDALEELRYNLLRSIKTMDLTRLSSHSDGVMVSYIHNIVHNDYIRFSKEYKKDRRGGLAGRFEPFRYISVSDAFSITDDHSILFFSDVQKILSPREYYVIWLLFHDGYTVAEIAKRLGKSRQAVNQAKNRAKNFSGPI